MTKFRPFFKNAFTLIELLVVMVIIAILAGLIFSAIGGVKEKGNATKCLSNLRQIGGAITAYCADHDGTLPGPLMERQPATWVSGPGYGSLGSLLEKYIGSTGDRGDSKNVMLCPSWALRSKSSTDPVYLMNFVDRLIEYDNRVPWGELGVSEPLKLANLASWRAVTTSTGDINPSEQMILAKTWAMRDADMGRDPVHGDYRNALFYDFHAGKLGLDNRPFEESLRR